MKQCLKNYSYMKHVKGWIISSSQFSASQGTEGFYLEVCLTMYYTIQLSLHYGYVGVQELKILSVKTMHCNARCEVFELHLPSLSFFQTKYDLQNR